MVFIELEFVYHEFTCRPDVIDNILDVAGIHAKSLPLSPDRAVFYVFRELSFIIVVLGKLFRLITTLQDTFIITSNHQ